MKFDNALDHWSIHRAVGDTETRLFHKHFRVGLDGKKAVHWMLSRRDMHKRTVEWGTVVLSRLWRCNNCGRAAPQEINNCAELGLLT